MSCVRSCRFYFSVDSTTEILEEFRPWLCPFDARFSTAMYYFAAFLPINQPVEYHNKGYKLWLEEFFSLWLHLCGDVQGMQVDLSLSLSSVQVKESLFIFFFSSAEYD